MDAASRHDQPPQGIAVSADPPRSGDEPVSESASEHVAAAVGFAALGGAVALRSLRFGAIAPGLPSGKRGTVTPAAKRPAEPRQATTAAAKRPPEAAPASARFFVRFSLDFR